MRHALGTALVLALLLARGPAIAEEKHEGTAGPGTPAKAAARSFHLGYKYHEVGPPAEWKVVGLLVYGSDGKQGKDVAGPFVTAKDFRQWLKAIPPGTELRYDGGCIAVNVLSVGPADWIKLDEIKQLCAERQARFVWKFFGP